jgi:hypothetical protein
MRAGPYIYIVLVWWEPTRFFTLISTIFQFDWAVRGALLFPTIIFTFLEENKTVKGTKEILVDGFPSKSRKLISFRHQSL